MDKQATDGNRNPSAQADQAPDRLPYTAPVLVRHGSIDSITHAAAGSGPLSQTAD